MFGIEDLRAMMAQYNLGRSDGSTKAANRDRGGGAYDEFYQEGYDDAVSGKRAQLPVERCEFVGLKDADDVSFAKRQVLHAFRSAVETEKTGAPASVIAAVCLATERIMGNRRDFFASSPACPKVKGDPAETPDDFAARRAAAGRGDTLPPSNTSEPK
jgi:hypothetical protein